MSNIDERARGGGRFGAATPGARPERASLESLLSPEPSRRRRPTGRQLVVAFLVLAVGGGGYAAGHYLAPTGSARMVSLVVTGTALPQGASLSGADLRVVAVPAGAAPPGALSPAAAEASAGLVVSQPVPAGAFLTNSELVPSGAVPGPDQAQVGLALKPGQVPAEGLTVGQRVLIVLLPQNAAGVPLSPYAVTTATIWSTSGPDSSGSVTATVVVPRSIATSLAGYASRGEVAVVAIGAAGASNPASPGG